MFGGFWCLVSAVDYFVDFFGPFSLGKQAEIDPSKIYAFQGSFLTKIHSGKFLPSLDWSFALYLGLRVQGVSSNDESVWLFGGSKNKKGLGHHFLMFGFRNSSQSSGFNLRTGLRAWVLILKFWRVTIRGAQPSARLSEEICLSEGSAGVSERALRGSLRGLCGVSARVLRGLCGVLRGPRDFPRVFGGSDPMLVTLGNCWI